ncbi:hypothetical protein [Lacticaseibacillus absianus]|uniref:hypothetical protein n=1 Tax=Lacticaseibacillus absianus TaxID=2729623 RepID=UPI0015CED600|nr:hypothetical protein [Lacticaseibacillus absianus]
MGNKGKALLAYQAQLAGATLIGVIGGSAILAVVLPSLFTSTANGGYTVLILGMWMLMSGWIIVTSALGIGLQNGVSRRTMRRTSVLVLTTLALIAAAGLVGASVVTRRQGHPMVSLLTPYAPSLGGLGGTLLAFVIQTVFLLALALAGGALGLLLLNASRKQVAGCGCVGYLVLVILAGFGAFFAAMPADHGAGHVLHQLVGLPPDAAPQPLVPLGGFAVLAGLAWLVLRQLLRWTEQPTGRKG